MKRNSYDIVVVVHRIFTENKRKRGGVDILVDAMSGLKKVLLIEHPLSALRETKGRGFCGVIVSEVIGGKIVKTKRIRIACLPAPINWVLETVFNVMYIAVAVGGKPVLISADPLNSLVGVIVPWKFSKRYFHCIDLSERRFESSILNIVYKSILKIVLGSFDYIGVVSLRIKKELVRFGCPERKIRYVPNSPYYKQVTFNNKEPHTVVCTGGAIIDKYDYDKIVAIMKRVKVQVPDVKFYAVGGVEQDSKYVSRIKVLISEYGLRENFIFTGFLRPRELEKILLKATVGISFYSENVAYYTHFGDSLKIREYALYGIPIICDGNSATDEEALKFRSGFMAKSVGEAVDRVVTLLTDAKIIREYRNNCIRWAESMDKRKIVEKLNIDLFQTG